MGLARCCFAIFVERTSRPTEGRHPDCEDIQNSVFISSIRRTPETQGRNPHPHVSLVFNPIHQAVLLKWLLMKIMYRSGSHVAFFHAKALPGHLHGDLCSALEVVQAQTSPFDLMELDHGIFFLGDDHSCTNYVVETPTKVES